MMFFAAAKQADPGAAAVGGVILILVIGVSLVGYLLPSIIGMIRGVPQLGPLVIVNVFLGWSLIGWVVALAWSFASVRRRPRYVPRRGGGKPPGPSFDFLDQRGQG